MDPNFRFDWLDTETKQLEWRTKLKDFLASDQISTNRCETEVDVSFNGWTKLPGLNINRCDNNDVLLSEIESYLTDAKSYLKNHYLKNKDAKVCTYANVLDFWRENCMKYPNLAKKAKKILAIPATSAAVERFFSKTGYIIRPHRRRMIDRTSENLFFLKGNHLKYVLINLK